MNERGEAIPAPVMCPSRHPTLGLPCDFSEGHAGACVHVKLLDLPGGRRKFPKKFEWGSLAGHA